MSSDDETDPDGPGSALPSTSSGHSKHSAIFTGLSSTRDSKFICLFALLVCSITGSECSITGIVS